MSTHGLGSGPGGINEKNDKRRFYTLLGDVWSHQKNAWLDDNGGTCVWLFLLLFIDHYFVWNERRKPWIPQLVFDMFEWIDDESWLAQA